jgi:NDP-sugar pyrophosphorylase family protein
MFSNTQFIREFSEIFFEQKDKMPWEVTSQLPTIMSRRIASLTKEYKIDGNVAIHKTAVVETGVTFKGPIIVGANCFIGAHAYLRGGVFLAKNVSIGPACEIKSSAIFSGSAIAHFNFIGDSLVGSNVNFEAGSVIANYHNERIDKEILINVDSATIKTGVTKFGALVGDSSKVGANAVLSPGTILSPNTVVKRLELINQTA